MQNNNSLKLPAQAVSVIRVNVHCAMLNVKAMQQIKTGNPDNYMFDYMYGWHRGLVAGYILSAKNVVTFFRQY